MPIYEFKCLECEEFFELLVMGKKEGEETKCPKCGAQSFERVLSTTSFVTSGGGGKAAGVSEQTRTCSGGSCSTYTIPGLTRD
jgi:putative FmdB family regulatory protein